MNAATRKKLLAYAIPVDLVIVATGVGIIVPGITPLGVIGIFVAAVALSAWKSGWGGAIAAMLLSAVLLFTLFKQSVQTEQIGWFAAASILVSIPMAALGARRRRRKARADDPEPMEFEPLIATPQSVEEAAAVVIDERYVLEREARARADGDRMAAERFANAKAKMEAEFARTREQLEREHAERFERGRAELQAAYDRERVELKAQFDAARLGLDAERAELQQQLDEERRRPAVIEKYVDEDAIAQRLEHLRAELQQQFEREMQPRIDAALTGQRQALERDSKREIEKVHRSAEERVATFRAELDRVLAEQAAAPPPPPAPRARQAAPPAQRGLFGRFFQHGPKPQLKLSRRPVSGENTANRRAAAAAVAESSATRRANAARTGERKARVLFLESRRATADTAAPRLRQLGIEVVIVERLVDAVDELYRFRPDVVFIDADLTDFEKAYRAISEQAKNLPLVLTSRNASSIPDIARSGIAVRPYDIDEVIDLARAAVNDPQSLLAKQNRTRTEAPPEVVPLVAPPSRERYDVVCYNCRVVFDAAEADWCSCLTPERTVVCTNCLTCFCKGTPAYKETFWLDAPQRLFERKAAELRRQSLTIAANLPPSDVRRPLVMLVDDDEDNQAIMQRVCANLGYGSVFAANGQDGIELARNYRPNLILADAFLPRLEGREMCRLLKEDPALADTRMVVMTGLYTDIQFKSEAVKRFRIDDYLAKPVSITDVINLLQRHLEGVLDLPAQENLYALHRKGIGGAEQRGSYEVACVHCGDMFDAATADWCSCAGGNNTFVCEHCGNCFCDAAEYRRRFWADAPAVLFERKMIDTVREVAAASAQSPADAKRPLIVLVERDESIRLLVKTVLSTLDYGFMAGINGEEGLALVREHKPDLVLVDALMPNVDGRGVCRQLKEASTPTPLKAIVMTGRSLDADYRQQALSQFKVDDCVAKPLAIADLLTMIRKHLPQEVRSM